MMPLTYLLLAGTAFVAVLGVILFRAWDRIKALRRREEVGRLQGKLDEAIDSGNCNRIAFYRKRMRELTKLGLGW